MSLNNYKAKLGACCIVPGCSFRAGTNKLSQIRGFHFPRNPERRIAWTQAVRRENWKPTDSSTICSRHFIEGKPSSDPTNPDWIPSIFPAKKTIQTTSKQKTNRFNGIKSLSQGPQMGRQTATKPVEQIADDTEVDNIVEVYVEVDNCPIPRLTDRSTMTDFNGAHYENLVSENQALWKRVNLLEAQITNFTANANNLASLNEDSSGELQIQEQKPTVQTGLEPYEQFIVGI